MRGLVGMAVLLGWAAPAAAGPASSSAMAAEMLEGMSLDVKLTLVDPGAEPRAVVRYRPTPGATASTETVSSTKMDMTLTLPDGQTMPMPTGTTLPSIVMSARNTVGKTTANGMTPVRVEQLGSRLEGAVAPEMAAAMNEALAGMNGMSFEILVDSLGRPAQVDVVGSVDPAMAAAVQSMADQMTDQLAHFPAEPVGLGAKWTVDMGMSMSGMDLVVQQSVTLLSITADAVELKTDLALDIGQGAFQMPGLPPGVQPEIKRFEGSGGGTMRTDLRTLASTGKVTMDMDMAMAVAAPDGSGTMLMSMKMGQTTEMRSVK